MKLNSVYEGDCLDIIPTFPSNSVDLVLTDPPFFMPAQHYQSRMKWQRNYADLSPLKIFWREVTKEVVRVLKPTGHFLTFCNCDSYPVFFEPMYNQFDKLVALVWNKKQVGLGNIWRHQHELIIAARWKESKINVDGKLRADVLSYQPTRSQNRKHPVEKPWELLSELISPITLEGDVVLDPFCGSGTTLKAAKILGRNYIGVDLNANYVDISKDLVEPFTKLTAFQTSIKGE